MGQAAWADSGNTRLSALDVSQRAIVSVYSWHFSDWPWI
jgi:hypothetical protein